jgi:enhancing lycopene biosynthesis protein 2
MAKVAVILSGCGRMDGSEVHESTLTLLYLAQGGAEYQCFAPDAPQVRVFNHVTRKPEALSRNQMAEAGRIARGNVKPLAELNIADWDALAIPGGSGALANLSHGPGEVQPDVRRVVTEMADAGKPQAFICSAPVLASRILGSRGVTLTVGNEAETIDVIEANGAKHRMCTVGDCVSDEANKVVSTPAYMLGPGIADIAPGIEKCIQKLLAWCK